MEMPYSQYRDDGTALRSVASFPDTNDAAADRENFEPGSAGARSAIVREARFDDYPEIADLQRKYGLDPKNYEEWSHLWLHNPAYCSRDGWPIGWVLKNSCGDVVGYIGNIPLLYELRGQTILAATGRAFVVSSDYRNYSCMLLGKFFGQQDVDLFLNTTVNAQAMGAYGLFRATRVPVGEWDRTAFWVTNAHGFTRSYLKSKSLPSASLLAFPLAPAVRLHSFVRNRRLQYDRGVKVDPCFEFDERFDHFWESLRRSTPRLVGRRDSRSLAWHFKYPFACNRVWVYTIGTKSRIDAYAIFLRDDNKAFGLTRIRLIDFQALGDRHSLLLPLLDQALQRCKQEKIHMLEIIGYCPEKRSAVDRFIPYRRTLSSWMYFYRARCRDLAEVLADPGAWDPSGFDGDSSF